MEHQNLLSKYHRKNLRQWRSRGPQHYTEHNSLLKAIPGTR